MTPRYDRSGPDPSIGRNTEDGDRRGDSHDLDRHPVVPSAPRERAHFHRHDSGGGRHRVPSVRRARPHREHHVVGWDRDRDRSDERCIDRRRRAIHKKLEEWIRKGRTSNSREIVRRAIAQVAGPSFFSLLVIGVSFFPVLALEAEEGRLFKPLAYTKILVALVAAVLAITLILPCACCSRARSTTGFDLRGWRAW